jgi:hypothetical protein
MIRRVVPHPPGDNEPHFPLSPVRFCLNANNVVFDVIDGEVLAIRSDSGAYYSMRGAAATAWCALLSGHPVEHLAGPVAEHHGADPAIVGPELNRFAADLLGEALLIPQEGEELGAGDLQLPEETRLGPWDAPTFEVYTDMQDLLLFDPIHEVDNSGWPRVAAPTPSPAPSP